MLQWSSINRNLLKNKTNPTEDTRTGEIHFQLTRQAWLEWVYFYQFILVKTLGS